MYIAFILGAFAVTCVSVKGITLSPCGSDNTVELVETSGDNTVTCSQIPSDYNVEWFVTLPRNNYSEVSVGLCNVSLVCNNRSVIGYTASRSAADTSELKIDPRVRLEFVRNGTLMCRAANVTSNICRLDIVSPPSSVRCQGVRPATTASPWNVIDTCNVTRIYSYHGRYSCQWSRNGVSTTAGTDNTVPMRISSTTEDTPTNGTYVNGVCDAKMPWPTVDADYTYTVVVSPGGLSQNAGNLKIKKPSPKHNCPMYVLEGQILTCTCSDNVAVPAAVLSWANDSSSDTLNVASVNRTQNGRLYSCEAVWNGTVTSTAYTLNVAYGPDSIFATAPDPFDTNGMFNMSLNCFASDVNPSSPTFTWTRHGVSDVIHYGRSYMFKPQPSTDDGLVFQCQAQNIVSNFTNRAIVTVRLNYPPTTDPVITTSSSDANLYKGDNVTFICAVGGGKPVNATIIKLICGQKQSIGGIVGTNGVSTNVTFNYVSDSDHNTSCTCNTSWKQAQWYTRSVKSALFVNTPPSPPNINVTSSDYPPVAGVTVNVTLTCASQSPGRPAAVYTWPVTLKGQPGVEGLGQSSLTFDTMDREDDGKTVTCSARNLYTTNRKPVADGSFTLNVYYHPVITLLPQEDNACYMTTLSTCEVTEGQRVNISCSAVSNPKPDNVTWHQDGGTYTQSHFLSIVAAKHTIHNGKYICNVTTGNLGSGRHPLKSSQQLTVLVKYKPAMSQLTINTRKHTTVNEAEPADFACQANGRPTPRMELINDSGIVVQALAGGDVVLEDKDTWLNYTLMTAQCQHAGVYWCSANNSLGDSTSDTAMLYVNCKPRVAEPVSKEPPSVNFVDRALQLKLHLVAYPLPQNFSFSYFGPVGNKSSLPEDVVDNILHISCTDVLYRVTCDVTVDNITSADMAGHYSVTVANTIGAVDVYFIITFRDNPHGKSGPWAAVGGGVAGGAVLVVVAVVIVFIRRQRQGPNQAGTGSLLRKTAGEKNREPDDETMIVNNLYGTAEGSAAQENQTRTPQRSDYEDVGLPPAAKPHVQSKPQVAATMSIENREKDTYSVVQKENKLACNSTHSAEYAGVDKSKTATEFAVRTETTAKDNPKPIQMSAKMPKPTQNKYKGKAKKEKKEDEQKLRKRPEHTKGAVYGNMPLSMNPIDSKVYENFGFQIEESEAKLQDLPQEPFVDHRSVNNDGLVYTTIQFTESQQKKAEHTPLKRETTEYVSIVLNNKPPAISGD